MEQFQSLGKLEMISMRVEINLLLRISSAETTHPFLFATTKKVRKVFDDQIYIFRQTKTIKVTFYY
jgi:hypothetical protein